MMKTFIVIENEDGLMVAQVGFGESNAEAAQRNGAVIVDEGPYHRFEDAYDAMQSIPEKERERASLRE
ncbi:hypothetical protein Q31b_25460 [Novipirellula aureliae]|uniref:Uncharacterized protein n=1 Tax=Novipirellula aureliae TaxID=2527966 RepID=A0A5C6E4A4_9BACT|nr:hypothetical protein [Novipirellula aureliae]TWU43505.1 hypothetical protein Q31b_25460 [Novipirellula aureliae]